MAGARKYRAEAGCAVCVSYALVGKILAHLGLLHPADSPGPAPPSADLRVAAPSHQ
jgi:hypothetical protein